MADLLHSLRTRIDETKSELRDANNRLQRAMADKDLLGADLQGYERVLSAELRRRGVSETVASPQSPEVPASPVTPTPTEPVSKAEFARQFIRGRADRGSTPADLYRGFQDSGIPINKAYVYALIQRLQKQEAILSRRNKWYPVPVPEQSGNGTGEKALP